MPSDQYIVSVHLIPKGNPQILNLVKYTASTITENRLQWDWTQPYYHLLVIVTRSGSWGFLLRLLPITETTLEYSLGPFILPRKPSLHVQAIWNHKPFAFTWVAQPSLLKSTAQLSSNLRAPPDFHTFNQSDLTILTWANQLLPHHFVAFMR